MIAPATASLLSRSLRTLVVRVRQHNASAQRIAEAMSRHPAVRRVFYPGLAEFPGHALAKQQMQGFGACSPSRWQATERLPRAWPTG